MSAVQQPRNRMTLWSRVARADRQAGEEQRNARAGVLLSKLVKGSGTKPGERLDAAIHGCFIASEEPKAMMLRTGGDGASPIATCCHEGKLGLVALLQSICHYGHP